MTRIASKMVSVKVDGYTETPATLNEVLLASGSIALNMFGRTPSSETIRNAIEYLSLHGGGSFKVPTSNDYNLLVVTVLKDKEFQVSVKYTYYNYRAPIANEARPYTNDPWQIGDVIYNSDIEHADDKCLCWYCYEGGIPGKWNSIHEQSLDPDYFAPESLKYSKESQRWAVGLESEYPGSAEDNSKYYSKQAEDYVKRCEILVGTVEDYLEITAPDFWIDKETMKLYMRDQSGVGLDFLVTEEDGMLHWKTTIPSSESRLRIAEDVISILYTDEPYLGKTSSDFMQDDVRIYFDGHVTGTFNLVSGFTEFSPGKPESQSGNYIYFRLGSRYAGKPVTTQRVSGNPGTARTATDTDWLLRLTDGKDTIYRITQEGQPLLELTFKEAILKGTAPVDVVSIPTEGTFAEKAPSDFMDGAMVSEDGEVTGTFKWVTGLTSLGEDAAQQSGNFICLKLGTIWGDAAVTVKKLSGTPSEKPETAKELLLQLTDGNDTIYEILQDGKETLRLTFKRARLELDPNGIISPEILSIPTDGDFLGRSPSALMSDVQVHNDGHVTGTFKLAADFSGFSSDPGETHGNYIILQLGSSYKGGDVTVQRTSGSPGAPKTANDTEWVLRLADGNDTMFKVTQDKKDPLILTFASATLEKEMSADKASIPAEGDFYGKSPSDLMQDVHITESGSVIGTIKHLSDYSGFSSAPGEQSGNFIILQLGSQYDGQEVSVQRTSDESDAPKTAMDTTWVLRLQEGNDSTFSITSGELEALTLSFKDAVLEEEP